MKKISFKKPKKDSGVNYTISKKNKYDYTSNWKLKHQVPILSELPNEWIDWSYLRFPNDLRMIPNDSGEYYDFIKFEPIKKGDVIYNYGDYIGVVFETNVCGDEENGYYIEIIYDKVFKTINNENVLVNERRVDVVDMTKFLHFFWYGLRVKKLSDVKYIESIGILPHYQSTINELNHHIKKLETQIKEYQKILGNLDKLIEDKAYQINQKNTVTNSPSKYPLLEKTWEREEENMKIRIKEQNRKDKKFWDDIERIEFNRSMEKIGSDGRNMWQHLYGRDQFDRPIY